MGLPAGWVTEVPGISRNDQLKALGNGVVPQQAAAALASLLADVPGLDAVPAALPTAGAARLLPTPAAGNFNDGESLASWEARRARNLAKGYNGNGQDTPLAIAVQQATRGDGEGAA